MTDAATRGVRLPGAGSRKRTVRTVVILVLVALLLCVPAYAVWQVFFSAEVDVEPRMAVTVEIPKGATTGQIAESLAEDGVIKNAAMFTLRARVQGIDGQLRPGVYHLSTGMEYDALVERLLEGPPIFYTTVTIPEGFTLEKIAERLEAEAGIPAAEFLPLAQTGAPQFAGDHPYLSSAYEGSLEGYLFPKTYEIANTATAADAIEMMLDQFDREMEQVDLTWATSNGFDVHDIVTVASMVEREARLPEERALMASVTYNRLAIGMNLEIDATIEYVIKKNRPRLLNSDLRTESPYNTYKYPGLPPGPIASPGLASLQAAAAPAQTQYLYYVLTGEDGSHTFCVTLEEFLIAKEKSREVTP